MEKEIIMTIKKTESKAEKMIRDAQNESRQIIADAEKKSVVIVSEVVRNAEKRAQALIQQAEKEANAEIKPFLENHKKDIDLLRKEAAGKMDQAVSSLAEKVVELDADS